MFNDNPNLNPHWTPSLNDTKMFNDNPNLNPHWTPSLNREGWGGSLVVGLLFQPFTVKYWQIRY